MSRSCEADRSLGPTKGIGLGVIVQGLRFDVQRPGAGSERPVAMAATMSGAIARGLGVGAQVPRLGSGYWGRGPRARAGGG